MSLPRAFMDELRARVPLSDLIGKRMKLTRAGREFKGCCPFHKEKTPSFYVNDQKGFYHCFGCGVHGDIISFLTEHDNMAFMDAVEQLAGIAGMQVPKPTEEDERKYKVQASLYDLMKAAAQWYFEQLRTPENKKIVQYLKERGLSSEIARSFGIGFAPQDEQGFKSHLSKLGFKNEAMIEAGIFKQSTKNQNDIYPFFRNRVMFPVLDLQGRVVAFGGRVLPGADKDAPKYINSPESPIFHKGRMLYGLSRARKAIGDGEVPIVVEGYMDVIALAQAGYKAAVAPLGTALTENQIEELWKVMPNDSIRAPILCFDGDTAGQRAASRALGRVLPILKPDHTIKFAFLPDGKDPDDLIKAEGQTAMDRVLKNAIGLFDMMWQEESKERDLNQPEEKAGFRAALEKRAREIADGSVQQFFFNEIKQKIAEVFLTKTSTYKKPFTPFVKGKPMTPGLHTPYRPQAMRVARPQVNRERVLLALMINHPALFDEFGENFGMIEMSDPQYDQLKNALINLLSEQNGLDYQAVKQHLTDSGQNKNLEAVFNDNLYGLASFAKPEESFETVREAWLDVWARAG